jgi:hypothetical protein
MGSVAVARNTSHLLLSYSSEKIEDTTAATSHLMGPDPGTHFRAMVEADVLLGLLLLACGLLGLLRFLLSH